MFLLQLRPFHLATTILQCLGACLALPVGRLPQKRALITCLPINERQHILFRDCIGALNMMGQETRDLNRILSFGIGSAVDVPIDGDPMAWEYGSCAVELQAQGDIPQLSSWNNLRNGASEISHSCSLLHREGFSYVDRLGLDSSPAALQEGPNLQLWVGPRLIPEDMLDAFTHYLSEQGSCSVNQRDPTHSTDITSSMVDSIATASSAFGPRRALLNSTNIECVGSNITVVSNETAKAGP